MKYLVKLSYRNIKNYLGFMIKFFKKAIQSLHIQYGRILATNKLARLKNYN